jgi:hypothetical protein
LCYRGRIDDQYGYRHQKKKPLQRDLALAINSLLVGEPLQRTATEVEGCHIGRKHLGYKKSDYTFYRDVLPILQRRCQQCHRKGDIGPFELATLEDVRDWAQTVRETVLARRMPPWKADPAYGDFSNVLRLTNEERELLVRWIDAACPPGDPDDAPPPIERVEGWSISEPDEIFSMPEAIRVPASGVVEYRYVTVSDVFREDRWVAEVECRIGNRSVVHHIAALLRFPENSERNQNGFDRSYFALNGPGVPIVKFPPDHAKRLPKGSQLVLQIHYTPTGTETIDRSSIGVVYANRRPKFEIRTHAIAKFDIMIPAGAMNHREEQTVTLAQDQTLVSLVPHMHLRGKNFEFQATYPSGDRVTLLSIPEWDFGWQLEYNFKRPLTLPRGTRLTIVGHWDNSLANPNNTWPLRDLWHGEQSTDEMFIGYYNYIVEL